MKWYGSGTDSKNEICKAHHMQIIRVENSYARRYHYIKEILNDYLRRHVKKFAFKQSGKKWYDVFMHHTGQRRK